VSDLFQRQKALLDQYPYEWVLLIGDQLFAHTPDEAIIWDLWDAAWNGWKQGRPEPMVVPPLPKRGEKPPPVRGRGVRPV